MDFTTQSMGKGSRGATGRRGRQRPAFPREGWEDWSAV